MTSGTFEVVEGLEAKLGHLPGGLWTESSQSAITMPILGTDRRPVGMLVLGVNVRRAFDDDYSYSPLPTPLIPPILPPSYISLTHRGYFELVTGQVSKAIGSATALQEEKKRAAILAELDRSKTIFFSNVSHEFRYAHHIAHSHLPHSFHIHTILTTYRRWVTTKHLSSYLMLAPLSLFLLSSFFFVLSQNSPDAHHGTPGGFTHRHALPPPACAPRTPDHCAAQRHAFAASCQLNS